MQRIKQYLRRDLSCRRELMIVSALCGAGVYWAGCLFCLLYGSGFSVMGIEAGEIGAFAMAHYKGVILLALLKIILAYGLLGASCGAAVGHLLYLKALHTDYNRRIGEALTPLLLFPLGMLLIFLLHDIARHPALYHEAFYGRGGGVRAFQLLITEYIPLPLLSLLKSMVYLLYAPLLAAAGVSLFRRALTPFRRIPRKGLITLLILALAFWGGRSLFQGRNLGPNVIILAADSFRYDRISAYGGPKALTPRLDALARDGFSFHNLHVQLPRTFPSWFTLLSGRYPASHGIRHMFPSRESLERTTPDLLAVLGARGFRTAAVADYAGDIFSRMKGFDRTRVPHFDFRMMIRQRLLETHFLLLPFLQNRPARVLFPELRGFAQNSDPAFALEDIREELDELSGEGRFLLAVFLSAPHFPYATPHPYYRLRTDGAYRGEYKYMKINDITRETSLTPADVRQIRGLYDGACRAVDDTVGAVIDHLKRRGLYDNTIILFTADHGENFYDDGLDLGHGEHFRGEYATRVPFILKPQREVMERIRGRGYAGVAEQADFTPTVLDLMNLPPRPGLDGVSLRPVLEGGSLREGRVATSETGIWFIDRGGQFFQRQRILYPDVSRLCRVDERSSDIVLREDYEDLILLAKHRTVFDGDYKLIYIPTREGIRYELYRMGDRSHRNLFRPDHPAFVRLRGYLEGLIAKKERVQREKGFLIPKGKRDGVNRPVNDIGGDDSQGGYP